MTKIEELTSSLNFIKNYATICITENLTEHDSAAIAVAKLLEAKAIPPGVEISAVGDEIYFATVITIPKEKPNVQSPT